MAGFMARGYKNDPFHRHVARSLANYFSPQTRAELQQVIEETPGYNGTDLYELLENNTVTAWGAKSDKRQDRELFKEMSIDDYFIMRIGQPNIVKADPDAHTHGAVCEITDVLVDDLDTETDRLTDAYSYQLRDLETGDKLPLAFRHHDLVPAEDSQ